MIEINLRIVDKERRTKHKKAVLLNLHLTIPIDMADYVAAGIANQIKLLPEKQSLEGK